MTQYFAEVLQKPTSGLDVPDLQAIAKDHHVAATLIMCRLTIAIGVQCEKNKEIIDNIQGLTQTDQHFLMKAIEQVLHIIFLSRASADCVKVMSKITPGSSDRHIGDVSMTE
jgi:protein HOOK3